MILRLSPLVSEAKPSAVSMPAWRSTSSSIPLPSTISPLKSGPSRSKARRLISITVTWWPAFARATAAMAPTRPQPTMTSFMNCDPILRSAAQRQPRRLNLGQPRVPDLGLGCGDVIWDAAKADGRRPQVNDGEAGVRIAIPRLAHAARVDQGTRRQRNRDANFGHLLPFLGEDSGQMGVTEEAEPPTQSEQDLERLEIVEDVLPDRIAGAAVDDPVAAYPAGERKPVQVAQALRCHHPLRPACGGRGVGVEELE